MSVTGKACPWRDAIKTLWPGLLVVRACEKIYPALNGPLTRCIKSRVAHAPGMPGTFSPPPRVSDPDMHHGTWMTHVPWCMPGSLTSGFLGIRCRGKRSRHSRRMRNPQFCVSGKWPMALCVQSETHHHETYYGRHRSNRVFVSESIMETYCMFLPIHHNRGS